MYVCVYIYIYIYILYIYIGLILPIISSNNGVIRGFIRTPPPYVLNTQSEQINMVFNVWFACFVNTLTLNRVKG